MKNDHEHVCGNCGIRVDCEADCPESMFEETLCNRCARLLSSGDYASQWGESGGEGR